MNDLGATRDPAKGSEEDTEFLKEAMSAWMRQRIKDQETLEQLRRKGVIALKED